MSAQVSQREEYSWWCPDCCAGSEGWSDDDSEMESEAEAHNAEYHAEGKP
jgi:hypothetical protein